MSERTSYEPVVDALRNSPTAATEEQMLESVTWLLPVRNGMPHLRATLESIERQTYPGSRILAWDNGSTDGTQAELMQWIPSRIGGRVICDQPLSLGDSLARLVEVAETELCARIDADDLNRPERLQRQVSFLRAHPEVAAVGAQFVFIDAKGEGIPGAWQQPVADADIRWRLRWKNSLNHPTVLFRRSALLSVGNYQNYPDTPIEDHDMWMRLALKYRLANLPEVLVDYRVHESSVTGVRGWSYEPFFDRMALDNADDLFPGIAGPQALRLRQLAKFESTEAVSLGDIRAFRRAAVLAAAAVNEEPGYFTRTALFDLQQKALLRRFLEARWWGRLTISVKRRLRLLQSSHG